MLPQSIPSCLPYHPPQLGGPCEGRLAHALRRGRRRCSRPFPATPLLTTGSKDLVHYAAQALRGAGFIPGSYPAWTPLSQCLSWASPSATCAVYAGPLYHGDESGPSLGQYQIKTLVTKASGGAGGFWEKAAAAGEAGVKLLIIDRPAAEERGLTYQDEVSFLTAL